MTTTVTGYNIVRGERLSLTGTASLPAGTWTATASIQDMHGSPVATAVVVLTPPVNPATLYTLTLLSDASTNWPEEQLNYRIKLTDGDGNIRYSPRTTFYVVGV
jgi:hypothetical protein